MSLLCSLLLCTSWIPPRFLSGSLSVTFRSSFQLWLLPSWVPASPGAEQSTRWRILERNRTACMLVAQQNLGAAAAELTNLLTASGRSTFLAIPKLAQTLSTFAQPPASAQYLDTASNNCGLPQFLKSAVADCGEGPDCLASSRSLQPVDARIPALFQGFRYGQGHQPGHIQKHVKFKNMTKNITKILFLGAGPGSRAARCDNKCK